MYGEWLREQFDKGAIPEPTYDPDLAILLSQLRENSINLFGPEATEVIEPVPMTDIRRAIKESLPGLIASIEGDERNVILTLARMWLTSSSSRICSKDQAAEWAIALQVVLVGPKFPRSGESKIVSLSTILGIAVESNDWHWSVLIRSRVRTSIVLM